MIYRLDKFLSNLKYGSRNEVKAIIKSGRVFVDDVICCDESYKINPMKQVVYLDGVKVFYRDKIILMIHKPKGILSANTDSMHPVVTSLLKDPYTRFDFIIAGRLDLDSHGLLILSTDGLFAHKLKSPKSNIEKTYEVILDKPFLDANPLLNGVRIKDEFQNDYLAFATKIDIYDKIVHITITTGKFHQVKRMFKSQGYEVLDLKRIQIGHLKLGELEVGHYKEITEQDIL